MLFNSVTCQRCWLHDFDIDAGGRLDSVTDKPDEYIFTYALEKLRLRLLIVKRAVASELFFENSLGWSQGDDLWSDRKMARQRVRKCKEQASPALISIFKRTTEAER